jgi:hypothetical protein
MFTVSFPLRSATVKKENHHFKHGITTISLLAVIAISTKTFNINVLRVMPLVSRLIDTRPARAKKEFQIIYTSDQRTGLYFGPNDITDLQKIILAGTECTA